MPLLFNVAETGAETNLILVTSDDTFQKMEIMFNHFQFGLVSANFFFWRHFRAQILGIPKSLANIWLLNITNANEQDPKLCQRFYRSSKVFPPSENILHAFDILHTLS